MFVLYTFIFSEWFDGPPFAKKHILVEQVNFSMMEIYNEQVRDLLNPASLKVKGGLKVRQHPNKGFYGKLKRLLIKIYL